MTELTSEHKTLLSNMITVRNKYRKMILEKVLKDQDISRVTQRLKAVEKQLCQIKESGMKEIASNG